MYGNNVDMCGYSERGDQQTPFEELSGQVFLTEAHFYAERFFRWNGSGQ